MSMSVATLRTELEAIQPSAEESDAISALVAAYATYAEDAVAGPKLSAAGKALGQTAMATALIGMSEPGAGITKIPEGLQRFWMAVAGGLATSFSGATAIIPPSFAGFAVPWAALMVTNTDSGRSQPEAVEAIADLIHTHSTLDGTVTFPGPVTTPIT